jgi:6-phosphogluconolactonase
MRRFSYRLLALLVSSVTALMLVGCPGFFTPRSSSGSSGSTPKFAFVANFQNSTAGSISTFTIDSTTGALTTTGTATATGNTTITNGPASLVTVLGKYLYSANDGGSVSAFSINSSTGALTAISGAPFLAGTNPNSIIADPSGKFLYTANSGSRDISAFSITSATGTLVQIGTFTAGASAAAAGQAVGLAMHPSGNFLYVALDTAGIGIFSIDSSSGNLTFVGSILPQGGASVQAITINRAGTFAYAADGSTSVEEFSINSSTGALTLLSASPVAAGTTPIVLTGDAAGTHVYVANQVSNNVFSYGILADGSLSLISGGTIAAGSSPSSIAIDPSGKFVYVTNFNGSPDVSVYTIDSSGKLVNSNSASTGVTLANAASIAFL